ncbi:hypothetical protein DOQ08_01109 [Marinobacter litoralis]|uniref:DUF349 domain-containing protein n=1 Tax=Marinobacter litoralis TaxID=187981 RepID=A0A3M2REQ0_9GAMM|nr:DUF349 domain-containing protein [Marinobacter litoralis]RMJ03791.1 hypothetical protein DOQ08_01109 [Marinobacter litoralis]
MAAFIQKLFKSRKTKATSSSNPQAKPEVKQPAEVDQRNKRREAQQQQLANAPEQSVLATLAVDGVTASIRLEAAKRLQDEALLQQVQKNSKGRDKSVYQTVRQSLQRLREQQAQQAATRQRISDLVAQAKDQAISENTKLFKARLDALQEQWQAVKDEASAEQSQHFLEAVHECQKRLQQIEQAQQEEARQQEQARQRSETLDLLQNTLDDLKQQDANDLPAPSSLDALQKTQENRWLEATRDTTVQKHEQKAYEQQMQTLRGYLNAVRWLAQEKDTISELAQAAESGEVTDEQRTQAAELIQQLEWPAELPQPVSLIQVRKLTGKRQAPKQNDGQREKQQEIADKLTATLPELETALEARQFKESKQLFKTAQNLFQQLDHTHRKPLQARMQLLSGQFRELSDWQGFATEPKQIALCEQMEYLAEQPMDPEAKAERIKELQGEWRSLGGSSDRTLWTRFKAASDQAYEPCKAYFEAKSDLKQANLDKRKAICDELSNFLENADWASIDWKAIERIYQTARQEWKEAWPVDFRHNRSVQKQFDELLKRLEQPLDEERKKNEALKQSIVERAQALITHEPLQEAMDQAKSLQTEWTSIGITRHREDRKMWQAFRKACDQIFARRDAQRTEQQQASQLADQAAQKILSEYQSVDSNTDEALLNEAREAIQPLSGEPLSPAIKEQVQQLKQKLNRAAELKKFQQTVADWQAFISDKVEQKLSDETAPKHWFNLAKAPGPINGRDLAIRAEILTGTPTPEQDQPRRMQIQVQRLSDGMGSTDNASPTQELEKLVALWCLHPDIEDTSHENAERLNQALTSLTQIS